MTFIGLFFAVVLAALSGWLLAIFMGHVGYPKDHIERATVGPIWIAIVFIVAFLFGAEKFWVNVLCGLSIAGFLVRSLWEYGLRCHEQVLMQAAVEKLSTPAERMLPRTEIVSWVSIGRRV